MAEGDLTKRYLQVYDTNLPNVLLFKMFKHEDFRGEYLELFKEKSYLDIIKEKTGEEIKFVEDDMSISAKHNLRGIHGDAIFTLTTCNLNPLNILLCRLDAATKLVVWPRKCFQLLQPFHGRCRFQ